MRHHTLAATAAAILALTALTACDPAKTTSSSPSADATATSSSGKTTSETKTVPNFVGKGLQSAQDEAQAAGFYNLASHDSLGRDRHQILDRDWKVCTQEPAAGTKTPTDTKLDFGTVKLAETCPANDQKAPAEAGATMPNFDGKSVKAARASLDSSTSITVKDATGDDRFILVESNWKVCTQDPKSGANLNGQPVTFTAVKYEETCP
ncbi:PASTA domain-containing protein [Streptomyces canus]